MYEFKLANNYINDVNNQIKNRKRFVIEISKHVFKMSKMNYMPTINCKMQVWRDILQ